MYKKILVAVDGSDTSDLALREAIKLAKECKAQLRLVHVIDETLISLNDVGWMGDTALRDALYQAGKRIMEKSLDTVRKAGLEAEQSLVESVGRRIASMIVEDAQHWQADLIVIGTHGRHGVDHLLLGSVAEGVARTTPVPLLLLRGR